MYTDTVLKCPEAGDWLAVTRVTPDGEAMSAGYLRPETISRVVSTLRELHARVEREGHRSAATVCAWEDFVNWAERNELGEREVVDEVRS